MKHDLRLLGRTLACALLAGTTVACATVTRGTHEAWTVETKPPGATVKTNIGFACDATPCTFKMEHKAEFDVEISKQGYKTYHGHVTHQVANAGAAGMAGNVLVGGLIGGGVDLATGAMMEIKPNPLVVELELETAALPAVALSAAAPTVAAP